MKNPSSKFERTENVHQSSTNSGRRRRFWSLQLEVSLEVGRRLQKSHLSGIRTLCSPSPLPSPSGRGSIVGSAFDNPSRLALLQRCPWFSLSLGERAGVRGNGPWKAKIAGVLQLALGCWNLEVLSHV